MKKFLDIVNFMMLQFVLLLMVWFPLLMLPDFPYQYELAFAELIFIVVLNVFVLSYRRQYLREIRLLFFITFKGPAWAATVLAVMIYAHQMIVPLMIQSQETLVQASTEGQTVVQPMFVSALGMLNGIAVALYSLLLLLGYMILLYIVKNEPLKNSLRASM